MIFSHRLEANLNMHCKDVVTSIEKHFSLKRVDTFWPKCAGDSIFIINLVVCAVVSLHLLQRLCEKVIENGVIFTDVDFWLCLTWNQIRIVLFVSVFFLIKKKKKHSFAKYFSILYSYRMFLTTRYHVMEWNGFI